MSDKCACQICMGTKNGVPGNENIITMDDVKIIMCDNCHAQYHEDKIARIIGYYKQPLGVDVSHKTPFYALRKLPKDIPNPNKADLVQVLINTIGGKAWINLDKKDANLDESLIVIVRWGREWLDITKVSKEQFVEYLAKYGVPLTFMVNTPTTDFLYQKKEMGV